MCGYGDRTVSQTEKRISKKLRVGATGLPETNHTRPERYDGPAYQRGPAELPDMPELIVSPREAYYGTKKSVALDACIGEISGEMLMAYPPGIPLICPGERITQDFVDYVKVLKEQHATLQGTADPYVERIRVLGY